MFVAMPDTYNNYYFLDCFVQSTLDTIRIDSNNVIYRISDRYMLGSRINEQLLGKALRTK